MAAVRTAVAILVAVVAGVVSEGWEGQEASASARRAAGPVAVESTAAAERSQQWVRAAKVAASMADRRARTAAGTAL